MYCIMAKQWLCSLNVHAFNLKAPPPPPPARIFRAYGSPKRYVTPGLTTALTGPEYRLETQTGQTDRLSVCKLNGSARLWRSQYNFCAFVIVEHYGLKIYKDNFELDCATISMDPGFAQGIAQIHALHVTYVPNN